MVSIVDTARLTELAYSLCQQKHSDAELTSSYAPIFFVWVHVRIKQCKFK